MMACIVYDHTGESVLFLITLDSYFACRQTYIIQVIYYYMNYIDLIYIYQLF